MTVQRSLRGLLLIHIAVWFAFASAQETQVNSSNSESSTSTTQPPPTNPPKSKFGTICPNNTTLKMRQGQL